MANYAELYDLRQDSSLVNRISIAVSVKAQTYVSGVSPTLDQLTWAERVLEGV